MQESNQLIQNYIEDVTIKIQNENYNDSDLGEIENRECQCGCLGEEILKMLSYFKWINKYYNLRNSNAATNSQVNCLVPKNIEKLNVEKSDIVEDNDRDFRVKRSFCRIDFSF